MPPVTSVTSRVLTRAGGPPAPRPRSLKAGRGRRWHSFRDNVTMLFVPATRRMWQPHKLPAAAAFISSSFIWKELHTRRQMLIQEGQKGPSAFDVRPSETQETREAHEDVSGGQTHHPH